MKRSKALSLSLFDGYPLVQDFFSDVKHLRLLVYYIYHLSSDVDASLSGFIRTLNLYLNYKLIDTHKISNFFTYIVSVSPIQNVIKLNLMEGDEKQKKQAFEALLYGVELDKARDFLSNGTPLPKIKKKKAPLPNNTLQQDHIACLERFFLQPNSDHALNLVCLRDAFRALVNLKDKKIITDGFLILAAAYPSKVVPVSQVMSVCFNLGVLVSEMDVVYRQVLSSPEKSNFLDKLLFALKQNVFCESLCFVANPDQLTLLARIAYLCDDGFCNLIERYPKCDSREAFFNGLNKFWFGDYSYKHINHLLDVFKSNVQAIFRLISFIGTLSCRPDYCSSLIEAACCIYHLFGSDEELLTFISLVKENHVLEIFLDAYVCDETLFLQAVKDFYAMQLSQNFKQEDDVTLLKISLYIGVETLNTLGTGKFLRIKDLIKSKALDSYIAMECRQFFRLYASRSDEFFQLCDIIQKQPSNKILQLFNRFSSDEQINFMISVFSKYVYSEIALQRFNFVFSKDDRYEGLLKILQILNGYIDIQFIIQDCFLLEPIKSHLDLFKGFLIYFESKLKVLNDVHQVALVNSFLKLLNIQYRKMLAPENAFLIVQFIFDFSGDFKLLKDVSMLDLIQVLEAWGDSPAYYLLVKILEETQKQDSRIQLLDNKNYEVLRKYCLSQIDRESIFWKKLGIDSEIEVIELKDELHAFFKETLVKQSVSNLAQSGATIFANNRVGFSSQVTEYHFGS